MEEKIFTLNIRKNLIKTPRWRRSIKAMKILKEKLRRISKSERVLIDKKLNEKIWSRGIEKPVTKVRIRLVKLDKKTVKAELVE